MILGRYNGRGLAATLSAGKDRKDGREDEKDSFHSDCINIQIYGKSGGIASWLDTDDADVLLVD